MEILMVTQAGIQCPVWSLKKSLGPSNKLATFTWLWVMTLKDSADKWFQSGKELRAFMTFACKAVQFKCHTKLSTWLLVNENVIFAEPAILKFKLHPSSGWSNMYSSLRLLNMRPSLTTLLLTELDSWELRLLWYVKEPQGMQQALSVARPSVYVSVMGL